VLEKRQKHLPYQTPFFEHNALQAAGIRNLPNEWRCADLFIFQRSREVCPTRPQGQGSPEEEFSVEETIEGVRIRVRKQDSSGEWQDPSLVSIVDEDILQSVSRRDKRRRLADVWTSGNRIFACKGKALLACILHALASERVPEQDVAALLHRELKASELGMVANATNQLRHIVSIERSEVLAYRAGVNRNGSAIPADC
jgi:hypothetical protein